MPRGFKNIQEHDEIIINNWNSAIAPDDDVYFLGDLFLNDNKKGLEILSQLNGKIHFIIGNHDTDVRVELLKKHPKIVEINFAKRIKIGKHLFFLSHYPTITANYDDKKLNEHLINLHGHLHDLNRFYNNNPYVYNVALDAHNNTPIEIQEILNDIRQKKEELNNESSNCNN